MKWYCEKCKKIHLEEEMCPRIKQQLKEHPEWILGASNFVTVAGEEVLVTSQLLDDMAKRVNKLAGTDLSYEGTQQFARDISTFKRAHLEKKLRKTTFISPETAREYYISAEKEQFINGKFKNIPTQLTGCGQEADWLRRKQGELSSLFEKSYLLDNNAPGLDGVTVNRFTGKEISRTTIKASKDTMKKNDTGIRQIKEAINKGRVTDDDIIFGPSGLKKAARDSGLKNPVVEQNTPETIRKSNERLMKKMRDGEAFTEIPGKQVFSKMAEGAIIGAAVEVSVSSITSYVRYRNGELTREEAFENIGEDTLKGALVGAALTGVTIFLPEGVIGFIAGMAVGVYFSTASTNILDEIFGKGAYGAILNSSGYVYGMTYNLLDAYRQIDLSEKNTQMKLTEAEDRRNDIERKFGQFETMKGEW